MRVLFTTSECARWLDYSFGGDADEESQWNLALEELEHGMW